MWLPSFGILGRTYTALAGPPSRKGVLKVVAMDEHIPMILYKTGFRKLDTFEPSQAMLYSPESKRDRPKIGELSFE